VSGAAPEFTLWVARPRLSTGLRLERLARVSARELVRPELPLECWRTRLELLEASAVLQLPQESRQLLQASRRARRPLLAARRVRA